MGLHLDLGLDLDQDLDLDLDPHLDSHLELDSDPHLDLHLHLNLEHASFAKDGGGMSDPPAPRASHGSPSGCTEHRHATGCLPCPGQAWGAPGESWGLQQPWREPWPPRRGEGQNGSGPAGLGCCSAVRLGLNVLQGGAEVREGDECRKHIKRGKLAAASAAA